MAIFAVAERLSTSANLASGLVFGKPYLWVLSRRLINIRIISFQTFRPALNFQHRSASFSSPLTSQQLKTSLPRRPFKLQRAVVNNFPKGARCCRCIIEKRNNVVRRLLAGPIFLSRPEQPAILPLDSQWKTSNAKPLEHSVVSYQAETGWSSSIMRQKLANNSVLPRSNLKQERLPRSSLVHTFPHLLQCIFFSIFALLNKDVTIH